MISRSRPAPAVIGLIMLRAWQVHPDSATTNCKPASHQGRSWMGRPHPLQTAKPPTRGVSEMTFARINRSHARQTSPRSRQVRGSDTPTESRDKLRPRKPGESLPVATPTLLPVKSHQDTHARSRPNRTMQIQNQKWRCLLQSAQVRISLKPRHATWLSKNRMLPPAGVIPDI